MEDWNEEDLEELEEEENEEDIGGSEEDEEESQELLEEIIQETPAASYPRTTATNRWPGRELSIIPEFSQSQTPLETGLQSIPTSTQEPEMAENAPDYSSITYQEPIRQGGQTETGYPEQIHTGSQSFSPSLSQHLMSSKFSTIPGTIQQRTMSGEPEQIRPQEKKYQSDFEQEKRDKRRF